MSLETSYEVQEMLRDDGVQTFRAKEKATGRELELHLFPPFGRPENKTLFERLKNLPLETRRRFLDIGVDGSTPFLVTDPLPAGRTFKVWAEELIAGSLKSAVVTAPMEVGSAMRDDGVQILQAGQWRTGTPIPDSLISKPPAPPAPPPLPRTVFPPTLPDDATVVLKAPFGNPATAGVNTLAPGEFTGLFQAQAAKNDPLSPPPKAPEQPPAVGEFTGIFQAHQPVQQATAPQADARPDAGEFTRMFQATPAGSPIAGPVVATNATTGANTPFSQPPEPQGSTEFTKFFESPLKPGAMSAQTPIAEPPPPPPTGGKRGGDFTEVFGRPSGPASSPAAGGFAAGQMPLAPPPPPPSTSGSFGAGNFSATGLSAPVSWSQPQAQPTFGSGPSEYTKMMGAPAIPTFGQAPYAQAPGPVPVAAAPKKSNLPIYIAIGAAVLLIIAIVVFLLMRGQAPAIPAAK